MSNIADDVLRTFFAQLAKMDGVSDKVVEGLREWLTSDRLPSADSLAQLYASGSGEALA
jgi:hypothetical protein